MPRETPSPIDLPEAPLSSAGLGWTAAAIAIATALLLVANAVSLRDWIDDLPPGTMQASAAALADQWVSMTETVAVGRPRTWLHDLWKAAEAKHF